jgi:large subunit ribosomal protein L7/L12
VIKEVRTALNLGLKEAKDLVEKLPAKLATGIPKKDADALLEKLKPSGGKIELA